MRTARPLARLAGSVLPVLWLVAAAAADTQVYRVTGGTSALTIPGGQLQAVGLALDGVRRAVPGDALDVGFDVPERYCFAISPREPASFRAQDGAFVAFVGGPARLAVDGGLLLQVTDSRLRLDAASISLVDASVELAPADGGLLGVIRTGTGETLFEIRNAQPSFHAATREVTVLGGDLVLSAEWARRAGRPELVGEWMGTLDLRLAADLVRTEATLVREPHVAAPVPGIEVLLKEVYGMNDLGRIGTYPNGILGLSFNTTSCNNGTVNVPWHAPMAEDHPFIGLTMYRSVNGARLEMLGKSWLKHAFYALTNDQCGLGCVGGGGGGYLMVGCSDTYSISNNGSQYYLGPRTEVNPHTCIWEACGSWFDGTPVDCLRSNDGTGLNGVEHRLEVRESELLTPGAQYFYEGVYYVMNDVVPFNNFMWRQVTPTWTGSAWTFTDAGPGLEGNPGPLIYSWGDMQSTRDVASDDGVAVLAVKTTSIGGGSYHYEYAMYNQSSDRGIERISVPVGTATITNAGFRDMDYMSGNQWTFTQANGLATWSTVPYPGPSNPVTYQSTYNFWFDADSAPQAASAQVKLYKPGIGDYVFFDTKAPSADPTSALAAGLPVTGVMLYPVEPNPFTRSTEISFALGRERAVRVSVIDVTGRLVKALFDGNAPSGRTALRWDGRDNAGSSVASGIYFFRLESGEDFRTTKGILLK